MSPLERMLLALELGIETQAIFEPDALRAELEQGPDEPS